MKKRVHFMGIFGSGMSAAAQIAHHMGFEVSGCDLARESGYSTPLLDLNIPVHHGHSQDHTLNCDILAVTPAVFYKQDGNEEVNVAREKGMLMKWQEFMSKYLHQNKKLICIAGTHGKSTTTTIAGLLLENAGLDPVVEVGATVKEWQNNTRIGQGDFFVSEADEYHNNFGSYHPDIAILNNIEMDHPEYFSTQDLLLETYANFINNIKTDGALIYNKDSILAQKVISSIKRIDINIIPYTLSEFPKDKIHMQIKGDHNKSNALGIIKLAEVLNIHYGVLKQTLESFSGTARRVDFVEEVNGISVYDDYANHPTAFKASIQAVKESHPDSKIIAVIEPHTFSRLKVLLDQIPNSLTQADEVIFAKIYPSREKDPGDFSSKDIVNYVKKHLPQQSVFYLETFEEIADYISKNVKSPASVLIMSSISGSAHVKKIISVLKAPKL